MKNQERASGMLTPAELEAMTRNANEALAFMRELYRRYPPEPLDGIPYREPHIRNWDKLPPCEIESLERHAKEAVDNLSEEHIASIRRPR